MRQREHLHAWWTNDGGRSWSDGVPLQAAARRRGLRDRRWRAGRGSGHGRSRAGARCTWPWDRLPDARRRADVGRHRADAHPPRRGQPCGPARIDGAGWARVGDDHAQWSRPIAGVRFPQRRTGGAAFPVSGEVVAPDPSDLSLRVQPNPSSGALSVAISLAAPVTSLTVAVFDALGREVARLHDGPLGLDSAWFAALDTSGWASGTYLVRASTENASVTARITVSR